MVVGVPNHLHCQITLDAAAAGKHVVCEKPLCLNLAEADRMIAACRQAGVKLMYAEELCFAPKYVRLKQLLETARWAGPRCSSNPRSTTGRTPRISGTSSAPAAA